MSTNIDTTCTYNYIMYEYHTNSPAFALSIRLLSGRNEARESAVKLERIGPKGGSGRVIGVTGTLFVVDP